MNQLNDKQIATLLSTKDFNITLVQNAEVIASIDNSKIKTADLIKTIQLGKPDLIEGFKNNNEITGTDLMIIKFNDQDFHLYYALISKEKSFLNHYNLLTIALAYFYNISTIEKSELLESFKKLKTVNQKIDFWEKKLGLTIIDYIEGDKNYYGILNDFDFINYSFKKDWEEINKWIISNYREKKRSNNPRKYLDLKQLEKDFKSKLSTTKKRIELCNIELKRIEDSFITTKKIASLFSTHIQDNFFSIEFNADYNSYKDWYRFEIDIDYSEILPSLEVISITNGKTLACYQKFIDHELTKLKAGKLTPYNTSENPLTLKQKILLLQHSGFLDGMKGDETNKARILAPIIQNGYSSVYEAIRDVKTLTPKETIKDLNQIRSFLIDQEENQVIKTIEKEIKKATLIN